MNAIRSLEDLARWRDELIAAEPRIVRVVVSLGSCGIAVGALDTLHAAEQHAAAEGLSQVAVSFSGCAGLCEYEPVVEVIPPQGAPVTYGRVTPAVVRRTLTEHAVGGRVVEEYVVAA
jgi:NADP-reducing hydrogenase subunit HndB